MAYQRPIPEHSAGSVLIRDKDGSVIWPFGEWTIYENSVYGWQQHVVFKPHPKTRVQTITDRWYFLFLANGETRRFRKWGHLLAFANDPENESMFN